MIIKKLFTGLIIGILSVLSSFAGVVTDNIISTNATIYVINSGESIVISNGIVFNGNNPVLTNEIDSLSLHTNGDNSMGTNLSLAGWDLVNVRSIYASNYFLMVSNYAPNLLQIDDDYKHVFIQAIFRNTNNAVIITNVGGTVLGNLNNEYHFYACAVTATVRNSYGVKQRFFGTGNSGGYIVQTSSGESEQIIYFTSGNNIVTQQATCSIQLAELKSDSIVKQFARGSLQMGTAVGSLAEQKTVEGGIQLFGTSSSSKTGIQSACDGVIMLGLGIQTNSQTLCVGDGTITRGQGSINGISFWGNGLGLTNYPIYSDDGSVIIQQSDSGTVLRAIANASLYNNLFLATTNTHVFSNDATKAFSVATTSLAQIVYGRVYCFTTNQPFSQDVTWSFYSSTNLTGGNVVYRDLKPLAISTISTNAIAGTNKLYFTDASSFFDQDLVFIGGTNGEEFLRVNSVIGSLVTFEDNSIYQHTSNDVVSKVGEIAGITLWNKDSQNINSKLYFSSIVSNSFRTELNIAY